MGTSSDRVANPTTLTCNRLTRVAGGLHVGAVDVPQAEVQRPLVNRLSDRVGMGGKVGADGGANETARFV